MKDEAMKRDVHEQHAQGHSRLRNRYCGLLHVKSTHARKKALEAIASQLWLLLLFAGNFPRAVSPASSIAVGLVKSVFSCATTLHPKKHLPVCSG